MLLGQMVLRVYPPQARGSIAQQVGDL